MSRLLRCSKCGWECKEGTPYRGNEGKEGNVQRGGLSLRDYFAAHAVTGLVARDHAITLSLAAKKAYEIADAMLEARAHHEQQGSE